MGEEHLDHHRKCEGRSHQSQWRPDLRRRNNGTTCGGEAEAERERDGGGLAGGEREDSVPEARVVRGPPTTDDITSSSSSSASISCPCDLEWRSGQFQRHTHITHPSTKEEYLLGGLGVRLGRGSRLHVSSRLVSFPPSESDRTEPRRRRREWRETSAKRRRPPPTRAEYTGARAGGRR